MVQLHFNIGNEGKFSTTSNDVIEYFGHDKRSLSFIGIAY